MPFTLADRVAIDEAFLGLTEAPGGVSFVVEDRLARPDGRLFGGTAIAVALAAIERATGRESVWATAQLAGTAPRGARVDCAVDVLATGRRASQVRVTATVGDDVVFVAIGAAAELKGEADAIVAQAASMPVVVPPDDAPVVFNLPPGASGRGWHDVVEMRMAAGAGVEGDPGRLCLWLRILDDEPMTAARLAFVADLVPLAVTRSAGVQGAGTSLDNTLRVGRLEPTDWVLVDLHPHVAWGGYGTGDARLFTPEGTLLAVASQSASLMPLPFDPLAEPPT